MEEMDLAIKGATTPAVQIWMNWMLIIFVLSIAFVWKHKSARIVFGAFILTLPIALLIFNVSQSAHLIGIAHIMVWGPLAYWLVKSEIKQPSFQPLKPYGIWLILLLATIAVSLIFDVRDIALVSMGKK